MLVRIESTDKIVALNGVPARIWEGTTAGGIPVYCYVTRIAVRDDVKADVIEQFDRELLSCRPPSAEVVAIPARLRL